MILDWFRLDGQVAGVTGAAAVVYLASTAGGHVAGTLIGIDGGLQQPSLDLHLADG